MRIHLQPLDIEDYLQAELAAYTIYNYDFCSFWVVKYALR